MDTLKVELRLWEREFERIHGRVPEKEDIRNDKDIKRKYKRYAMLKRETSNDGEELIKKTPVKMDSNAKIEFGPTPQISGKLVSIFEMKFSSLKPNNTTEIVSSPIKPNESVKRQLNFSITPNSSPMKEKLELAPAVSRSVYGPNSPLKLGDLSVHISETPRKVRRLNMGRSPFSPNPLIKRPAKSLYELAREHEVIKDEFEIISRESGEFGAIRRLADELKLEEEMNETRENDNVDDLPIERRYASKAKTIKKRTKAKMRPALQNKPVNLPNKNVHAQIAKLKEREYNKLMGNDVSESESEEEVQPKAPKKVRKSKYNLVSNNFKRLKLPTKKRNNSNWGRRR